jgi:putative glutamine amidotransferase
LRDPDTSDCRRDGLLLSYARSVAAAGGAPVLLPNLPDPEIVEAAVRASAGLLLSGGVDVAADAYGCRPHATMDGPDRLRDATERLAIEAAMRLGRPILGICRGIQVLNVVLGGSLIQDIPSHKAAQAGEPEKPRHPQEDLGVAPEITPGVTPVAHGGNVMHEIVIDGGSILHDLWRLTTLPVNSSHHQAVAEVAPSLKVIARAADGIVEAVQAADGYPMLAVQFHPERLAHKDEQCAALFRWLVAAARRQTE